MTSKVKVKAGSSSVTRRFEINSRCSWEELNLQVRELFDLEEDFTLKYIDDEDELVTLGTHGELEEALKITQSTGLLRLVVEISSDQQPFAGIESFRDLLGESPKGTPVAPKRKFVLNSSAQSETSGAYKTPKMDDEDSSATASASSSQEASLGISSSDFESPSKKNKLQFTEHGSETADAELQNIDSRLEMRSPLMSKPLTDYEESEKVAPGEQYIPLVQLMVPPPSAPPPRPPPPSSAPKKVAKGSKSKNCYHQLAESVAAELATVNERLHQKLRSSFEKLQSNEQLCNGVQALEEVEEDTYVLVNQRGNLATPNEDLNLENESSTSSPDQPPETDEESIQDKIPVSPENSLASDGSGPDCRIFDHAAVEETVQRVVQQSLPRIVEQTLKSLQGLNLNDNSAFSPLLQMADEPTTSKVVHKGIFCAECSQAVIGIRYKCCFCTDYDLCEDCESKEGIHHPDHFFAKLRNHVPGIGRKNGEMVPVLKKFVYRMALKEEGGERKEEKKRYKEERKDEKRRDKDGRKEEKRRDRVERKEKKRRDKGERKEDKRRDKEEWTYEKKRSKEDKKERRKDKLLREEKDKKELRRRLKQIRLEMDSATTQERLQNCLNAEFIADASIPDGTALKGGEKFLKRWIVQNKGRRWNARTVLQCVEGNIIVASGENVVQVPFLKLDEQGELAVAFITPAAPGHYESKWQLCHHSIPFGPLFWCQITVEGENVENEEPLKESSEELLNYPSHDDTSLLNSAFPEHDSSPVVKLVEHIVPEGVLTEDGADGSGSDAYLSSEDTAEFEKIKMPLESVLIASQVAQVTELEWDTTGCSLEEESCDKAVIEELVVCINEDAASDVESILSDMSDAFMVVPVPPCFDPEAPLTADPTHVTVSMTEYKQLSESHQAPFSLNLSGHTSLEAEMSSGGVSASYTGQTIAANIKTILETDSNTDQRVCISTERTSEMTTRTSTEQENHVFDLANETVPVLPEPLIPEPGQDAPDPVLVDSAVTDSSSITIEPEVPIVSEPLPVPEPVQDENSEDGDDDEDEDGNDGPAQPEESSQPIAAQPVLGTDGPTPVALQPEPAAAVNVVPTTVRPSVEAYHISTTSSSDFTSNVVSDVLSTAIDAVASAGRAVITTVDNFLAGGPKPQPTATYNTEEGCEISVSPSAEGNTHDRAPKCSRIWTTRTVRGNTKLLELAENRDAPDIQLVTWPPGRSPGTCLECLMEMGFCDRKLNEQLLKKHNNNVALVVNELLTLTDNEWSERRH